MSLFTFLSQTSYTFDGKKDDETVALFLHRHWFTIFNKVFAICIATLLPFIVLLVFGQVIIEYKLIPLFTFMWATYILLLWYVLFYIITMYTLDYWVVTNERIVDSIQCGFFNRQVSELSLSSIQDISTSLEGFLPTTMNYGSVKIQTAARENHFYFDEVPNPQKVKDTIMELVDQIEQRKEGRYFRNPRTPVTRHYAGNTGNAGDAGSIGDAGDQGDMPQINTPREDANVPTENTTFSGEDTVMDSPRGTPPTNLPVADENL